MIKNARILNLAKFVLPFLVWIFLFRDFFAGRTPVSIENYDYYTMIKFFLDHLRQGVVPLWNPHLWWGFPMALMLSVFSAINPLWLVCLGLNFLGATSYQAYFIVFVAYYFIALLGFYCLARRVLDDARVAYVGFLILTFSSFGISLFMQPTPLLLFTPAVWFFYFLACFLKECTVKSWWGLTLTTMLLITTYLPFYFLTLFITIILPLSLLYVDEWVEVGKKFFTFVRRHYVAVLLAVVCVVAAGLPSYFTFQRSLQKEFVAPNRTTIASSTIMKSGGFVMADYKETTDGGISGRMFVEDLYAHLDQIPPGNDGLLFVSLFAFLVLILGFFNPLNRRIVLLFTVSLILFLLCITNAGALHPFLYKHVGYFKLFRNLHFLLPFLLASVILLAMEQLRLILDRKEDEKSSRILYVTTVLLVHLGAAIFLSQQTGVIISSHISVALSCIFFLLLTARAVVQPILLWFVLILCVVAQPLEVLWKYNQGLRNFVISSVVRDTVRHKIPGLPFSYTRQSEESNDGTSEENFYRHFVTGVDAADAMTDAHGFPPFGTFFLYKNTSPEILRNYARYKFYLYDRVELFDKAAVNWPRINQVLQGQENLALVAAQDSPWLKSWLARPAVANPPQRIEGPSDALKVTAFGPNRISFLTDFPEEKFLVYTDGYSPYWQAFINKLPVAVLPANIAFKGLILPAGKNEVELRYEPPGQAYIYLIPLFLATGILMFLIFRREDQ